MRAQTEATRKINLGTDLAAELTMIDAEITRLQSLKKEKEIKLVDLLVNISSNGGN